MTKQIAIDLGLPADEMKEFLQHIPSDARESLNDALTDMIEKAKIMQALNVVYALKDKLEPTKTQDEKEVPNGVTIQ